MKKLYLKLVTTLLCSFIVSTTLAQITDPSPYCSGGYDDGSGAQPHYISRVRIGSLDNNTGTLQLPGLHYGYYNTVVAPNLNKGDTYTLTVDNDNSLTSLIHFIAAYIDFNNDGDFTDPGENVLSFDPFTATDPAIATVTIPATATAGVTRMRVMVFEDDNYTWIGGATAPVPCTNDASPLFDWGETEDYNVNIVDPTPCDPLSILVPITVTESSATINWPATAGSIGYEWLINTTASLPTGSGIFTADTSASLSTLLPSTTYYAHVRVKCSATSFSTWLNVPFTTTAPPPCDTMTGLSVSGITLSSATISWDAAVGTVLGYQYVVNTSAAAPTGSGTPTTTTSVDVTGLTMSTTYYAHVRVRCSTYGYSSWLTVPFTTVTPIPCAVPTSLSATDITTSGATLSWASVSGAIGYEYVISASAASPTSSGTATIATSVSASGLTAATTYYLHVRAKCDAFSYSSWVSKSFTTLPFVVPCDPVSWISFSAISSTSVTFNWSEILSTSVGYKYVVDNSLAAPTVFGTYTTLTSATVTGLSAGTTYYAHVRDTCTTAASSSWVTKAFNTPVGVEVVLGSKAELLVYPNPANDIVYLKLQGLKEVQHAVLTISDISGRVIAIVNMNETNVSISVKEYPAGVYIVKYLNGDDVQYMKFLKN